MGVLSFLENTIGSEAVELIIVVVLISLCVVFVYVTFLSSPGESKQMMRVGFRTKLGLKFPPFAVQSRGSALIVAGGGGDSKTGVPNQIALCDGTFEEIIAQDTGTKTIFGLNFHPTKSLVTCSVGCDNWIMEYSRKGFRLLSSFQTVVPEKRDSEQRTSLFVGGGSYLMTGGSNGRLSVFEFRDSYSKAEKVSEVSAFDEGQYKDAHAASDFSVVVAVGKKNCKLWRITNGHQFSSDILLVPPSSPQHDFSGARLSAYGPILYTAEILPRKMSIVKKWRFEVTPTNLRNLVQLEEEVVYKGNHHTSFDMSACGRFLALGSPTGEVVVVSTASMSVIAHIQAHGFTVTNITFSVPFSAFDLSARVNNINNGNDVSQSPSKRKLNRAPAKLDFDDLSHCYTVSCALDRGLVAKSIERNKVKTSSWWKYAIAILLLMVFLVVNIIAQVPSRKGPRVVNAFELEDNSLDSEL